MMDRRSFLKNLVGASVVASTNPVHFLAPPNGWMTTKSGLHLMEMPRSHGKIYSFKDVKGALLVDPAKSGWGSFDLLQVTWDETTVLRGN